MSDLVLYSTEGCHLCELAEALLEARRRSQPALGWRVVDIADDDELFQRYGWHIPVLADSTGNELRWPFDETALAAFLAT